MAMHRRREFHATAGIRELLRFALEPSGLHRLQPALAQAAPQSGSDLGESQIGNDDVHGSDKGLVQCVALRLRHQQFDERTGIEVDGFRPDRT